MPVIFHMKIGKEKRKEKRREEKKNRRKERGGRRKERGGRGAKAKAHEDGGRERTYSWTGWAEAIDRQSALPATRCLRRGRRHRLQRLPVQPAPEHGVLFAGAVPWPGEKSKGKERRERQRELDRAKGDVTEIAIKWSSPNSSDPRTTPSRWDRIAGYTRLRRLR